MSLFSRETLHVKISAPSPFLRGILYFFLTIPLVLFAAEIIARSPLGHLLPAPSINADSFLMDAKIFALEQQFRRDGKLDCLILGSSVANSDIDPEIIERVYREQTGENVHCYNLGLPAMTIETATAIADSVIARFHPKTIVYAVLPRDINDAIANVSFLEDIDWVKYNRGDSSIEGWLVNNSYAWRYFIAWRYWLVTPNRLKMAEEVRWLTSQGFQPALGIREPYIANLTMRPERLSKTWKNPRGRQNVERFLSLREKGVNIILVEGPNFREPDGSDAEIWQAYENDYLPTLLEILETNNIPFWRTDVISSQIPRQHWYDWLHLNRDGAVTFSQWLGEQMAENEGLFK